MTIKSHIVYIYIFSQEYIYIKLYNMNHLKASVTGVEIKLLLVS
jgi:hypothetical protein